MQEVHRLKNNREFRRVYQRGKSLATGRLVLYWYDNQRATYRAGFSISKKVGNAVTRNRLKRRLRECFAGFSEALFAAHVDFIVVCRQGSANASFQELESDLVKLLRKAKFMV